MLAGSVILGCMFLCFLCFTIGLINAVPIEDGAARIGAAAFGDVLNAVFASVGQRAVRKVARETFEHLLSLDLRFHLSRQTGGLIRAIDRGTKFVSFRVFFRFHLTMLRGITFLLQGLLFRIAPTVLEISMVCGILVGPITMLRCDI